MAPFEMGSSQLRRRSDTLAEIAVWAVATFLSVQPARAHPTHEGSETVSLFGIGIALGLALTVGGVVLARTAWDDRPYKAGGLALLGLVLVLFGFAGAFW